MPTKNKRDQNFINEGAHVQQSKKLVLISGIKAMFTYINHAFSRITGFTFSNEPKFEKLILDNDTYADQYPSCIATRPYGITGSRLASTNKIIFFDFIIY